MRQLIQRKKEELNQLADKKSEDEEESIESAREDSILLEKREEIDDNDIERQGGLKKIKPEDKDIEIDFTNMKDSGEEFDKLKEIILNNFKDDMPKAEEIKPEEYIRKWDFQVSKEQKDSLEEHNQIFKNNFTITKTYHKKFDYAQQLSYSEKCDDILAWVIQTVNIYTEDIHKRSVDVNIAGSPAFRKELGHYRELKKDIQYLLHYLREKKLNAEICESFFHVVHFCMLKEYKNAHDRYLDIAIGNKTWPIGITMFGVHERTGKSRIIFSYILR